MSEDQIKHDVCAFGVFGAIPHLRDLQTKLAQTEALLNMLNDAVRRNARQGCPCLACRISKTVDDFLSTSTIKDKVLVRREDLEKCLKRWKDYQRLVGGNASRIHGPGLKAVDYPEITRLKVALEEK